MELIIQHRCRAAITCCRPAPQSLVLAILVCAFLIGIWRLVIDGILRSTWNYRWGARSSFYGHLPPPDVLQLSGVVELEPGCCSMRLSSCSN